MARFRLKVHATVEYMNEYEVEVEAETLEEAAKKASRGVDYERVERDCPVVTRYGQIYDSDDEDGDNPLEEF